MLTFVAVATTATFGPTGIRRPPVTTKPGAARLLAV
jgi:hypothetical protein